MQLDRDPEQIDPNNSEILRLLSNLAQKSSDEPPAPIIHMSTVGDADTRWKELFERRFLPELLAAGVKVGPYDLEMSKQQIMEKVEKFLTIDSIPPVAPKRNAGSISYSVRPIPEFETRNERRVRMKEARKLHTPKFKHR